MCGGGSHLQVVVVLDYDALDTYPTDLRELVVHSVLTGTSAFPKTHHTSHFESDPPDLKAHVSVSRFV